MGLLDTILGRTKPVPANLDSLFGLPSAAITLQSGAGITASGRAGVCYKPPTGQGFEDMQAEVMKLLAMDDSSTAIDSPTAGAPGTTEALVPSDSDKGTLRSAQDSYGYHWVILENPDIEALVTQVHLVNSSLADAGWGPPLLCSVFGLAQQPADADPSTAGPGRVLASNAFLVYLFKRGTFYPFVPQGHERRDMQYELKLKSLVGNDLKVEPELDRWFPLWDLPVG